MDITSLFESWRSVNKSNDGWGLAWFLAHQFCMRFYSSHGICPTVIEHDGLGYYGIQLKPILCKSSPKDAPILGRMTISGDVENWVTGGPGQPRLNTSGMSDTGSKLSDIVVAATRYMELPVTPQVSHIHCRHKRWGKSYELGFTIATIIALRNRSSSIMIWNDPYHTSRVIADLDPQAQMNEHLGAFIFSGDQRVVVTGDGRLLGDQEVNYWHRYMQGESAYEISLEIERMIYKHSE